MSSSTAMHDRGEPAPPPAGDPALLRAMADPATYDATTRVAVHETHASWVFVTDGRAYKVKKPVVLGFLDYRTPALRRAACEEEVRVNAELAGDLYLGVCAIVRSGEGFELAREHDPGAVEYAVEMRSFDESDSLAGLIAAGALRREQLEAVARRLADFHRRAPRVDGARPRQVLEMWERNLRELAAVAREQGIGWTFDVPLGFCEAFVALHAEEIERRRRAGLVRDGHGDLRCEHVLAVGAVRIVDRIEFDPAFRHTDIACDLAFLAMDLEAFGQRWAAEELIGAYRRNGLDLGSEALLAFYGAHRAFVRAKVALIAAGEHHAGGARAEQLARAEAMWALGERLCWRAREPLALILCGPAASGKSTLAQELSRRSGFEVLSSDAIRKLGAGLAVSERAGSELYDPAVSRATYERLGLDAKAKLESGRAVIVDATCRLRSDRARLFEPVSQSRAPFLAVRCSIPLAVALERAHRRMQARHVSDATPEIVAEQFRSFEELEELPAAAVYECDTQRPLGAQVDEVAHALDRSGAGAARTAGIGAGAGAGAAAAAEARAR